MRRVSFTALMVLVTNLGLWSSPAQAATNPVFAPGDSRLFLLLQGLSAGQTDPEPRRLYDMMAMASTPVTGGGDGKGVKTADKAFTLGCVARQALPEDVICTIVTKSSARSKISSRNQSAEFAITDAEAATFYNELAGPGATEPFSFDSADGQTHIESTRERFYFRFKR